MGNILPSKVFNGQWGYTEEDRENRRRESFARMRERLWQMDQIANCEYSIPAYLKIYMPEFNADADDVKTFLALGELCDNSLALIKMIDEKGNSIFLEETFDSDIRQTFRSKLEIIRSKCINKAKQSLETFLKLPTLPSEIVFENLKVHEDWNIGTKFEEVEKEDLELLRKTFADLAAIYAVLRDPTAKFFFIEEELLEFGIYRDELNHHFFCDRHQDWYSFTPEFELKRSKRFVEMKDAIEEIEIDRF